MKTVLVTGATGFVGGYVITELLRRGVRVIASSARIAHAREMPWFGKVQYQPFDLSSLDPGIDYYQYFGSPDAVLHLAWEGLPHYKEDFHVTINYPRHAAFLDNLVRHGLRSLTVTGTCLEYGMQEGALKEDLPPRPANAYAVAKNELRRFLEGLQHTHPFVFRWVRLFYMYGKGQSPNSLLSQLDKALDNREPVFNMSPGDQLRDYLPVEQVADHLVRIAMQDKVTGVINCCSGEPVQVKDVVMQHLARHNRSIPLNLGYYPYPDHEPRNFWGDSSKLNSILLT